MRTTLFLLSTSIVLGVATPALAGDVTITLDNVEASQGDLYVSLQTEGQFMKPEGKYGEIIKAPAAGPRTITLKNVAPGDYSVSVWHDTNNDRRFTQAPNGMPLDGWSMFNAENLRAKPSWSEVKFTVPDQGRALNLTMLYPKSQ